MSAKEMVQQEKQSPRKTAERERRPVFVPDADIVEAENEFRILADMPGVDENSVEVDVENNVLTVHGEFVPQAPEGYSLTWQEYRSGNYERSFTLGNTVDRENIQASVRDGVLRLVLPKAKEAQPRRIEVKAG